MLFDLRGRGRRRTIQVIYALLALILGGGLVFFGIGGASNGGLLNAVGQNGSTGNGTDTFANNVKAAEKKVAATPKDPAAWAALVHARYVLAGNGGNYDAATGTFTTSGLAELQKVKQAWDQYLALKPATPSGDRAREMVTVLGPKGLNEPASAVAAQELIVAQGAPTAREYAILALFAYLAHQTRKGDLAAAQAITLAPKTEQAQLKQQLASAKVSAAAQGQTTQTTPTSTLPSG